jgi:hypothetical protein
MAAATLPPREKVDFPPNTAVTVALKFNQGKTVSNQYGESVMFTTTENRVFFLEGPMTPEQRSTVRQLFKGPKQETTTVEQVDAIERLFRIAMRDTGQSRRVANFLLAWYNAGSNGGWDPADLWAVDTAIADDMMTVLGLIRNGPCGKYPNDWGFRKEIEAVWDLWRKPADAEPEAKS